jgi:hypothetical protein
MFVMSKILWPFAREAQRARASSSESDGATGPGVEAGRDDRLAPQSARAW